MPFNTILEYCRSCSSPVYWLRNTTTNKPSPIDSAPSELGNCLVDFQERTYSVLNAEKTAEAKQNKLELYLSHFATCPNAKDHRKTK